MTSYEATATPVTLLELVTTIAKCGVREAEVVEIAAELVNSGRVRLTGNFRGAWMHVGPPERRP